MAFESRKNLGEIWDPSKDADGNVKKKADPKDYIDGLYVDLKENVGEFGSNLYVVQTDDGEKVSIWGNKVLNDQMETVAPGSYVRIQYHGWQLKKSKTATPKNQLRDTDYYKNWEVFVDKDKSQKMTTPSHLTTAPVNKPETATTSGPEDDGDSLPF